MKPSHAEVVVLVLDNDPTAVAAPWGFRGHVVFRGRWEATAEEIAVAAGELLGTPVRVHTTTMFEGTRWIALRWATEYSSVTARVVPEAPASGSRLRAAAPRSLAKAG